MGIRIVPKEELGQERLKEKELVLFHQFCFLT